MEQVENTEAVANTAITEDQMAPAGDDVSLNLNDLVNIKHIVDVASARGAFKPDEFAIIGTVYNRLDAFVAAASKAEADKAAADTAAEAGE